MMPLVLTDDPDAGTVVTVPLGDAIKLAGRRYGSLLQTPERAEMLRLRREAIEALLDEGLRPVEITRRLRLPMNSTYPFVKRYRARRRTHDEHDPSE